MKIAVISVLYNQEPGSCETWKTLLEPALREGEAGCEIHVILADNSTEKALRECSRKTAEAAGARWLDMQGNRGLPAACNRAIEEVLKGNDDWIIVTDQDTSFPENYLKTLKNTAETTECGVLAPAVTAGDRLLSPCRRKGSRFVPYAEREPGDAELQEAFFINTGLAFRRTLFDDPAIRYEERLFLDFADFDLISRIRSRAQARFGMLPGIVLQQHFSGTEKRTADQDLERFRHFVHDGRLFYERWYGKDAAEGAIRRRAVRLFVKHRDIRFLKKNGGCVKV